MFDFLTHLFDTSGFMPRWQCGTWTSGHGWLHIVSDLGVWSAYVAIPCVLGYFVLRRKDIPFRTIFWLFGAFILACGTTHLMEAIIFWWPAYRLAGVIKLYTAVVSWSTVVALIPVTPKALAMRSPEELEREIAARKQAEDALQRANAELERRVDERTAELRQSEAQFRRLADALPHLVWTARADGFIDYYNERWYEYTGFPRGVYGDASWEPIVHPDDVDRCKETYYRCIRTGEPYQIEYRFKDPASGGYRWFLGRAYPVRDAAGTITRWFGTCTDIDDAKRLEEEVRAAASRIHSVLENVIDGIITIDERGVVEDVNPAVERLFGWKAPEVVGCNVNVLMPEPYHREHDGYIAHYLSTGEARVIGTGREVVGRRNDGTTFPLELTVGEFRWGGRRFFTGVVRDISQRKQDEATLRKQNQRLRLLWEAAALLLTTDDLDTMLRALFDKIAPTMGLDAYFNFMVDPSGEALRLESCTGIPDAAARSISRLEFGQAVCGTVAVCRQAIDATFIQESDDPKVQLVKSFGIRTYACNPLMAEGRLLGTLSFASRTRDRLDEDELEFLRTICHYVTVAYERLRLVRELKDNARRKDEFLAMLAHELRNPMAPIRNAVQILRMQAPLDPSLQTARDMIDRQVGHMVRLVDDLLDVSRISRGKITLRTEPVELADVVATAVESSRPLIDARKHELEVVIPSVPLRVWGDLTRLVQVLLNILNNAAKYTPEGGHIRLAVHTEDHEAVIRIRDDGVGIAQELLPKVFDLFTQAERTLDRSQGGLGIGLTLVKKLTEMHAGTVEARSPGVGHGSEFVVRLPLMPEVVASVNGIGSTAAPSERSSARRVLVVDDNRDAADSLTMLLAALGNQVRTAADGYEALGLASEFRPDLIFLDIGLPGMDGFSVARKLRANPALGGAVLVAVTGYGSQGDRRQSEEAGFFAHLVKPVEFSALEELLASLPIRAT